MGFRLAPRLNAGGRLEEAGQGVELLTAADQETAERIATHLEENNRIRQSMEQEITQQALLEMRKTTDFYTHRAIVVIGDNWTGGGAHLRALPLAYHRAQPQRRYCRGLLPFHSRREYPRDAQYLQGSVYAFRRT